MPETSSFSEFEDLLRRSMATPEADPLALQALRERFLSQGTAALGQGQPAARRTSPARNFFSRRPAWQWALVGLIVLIALALAVPGAVKALRQFFGYIPGIGVIEEAPSILILSEPVQVEQRDVLVTVEQAVSTAEKTVVIYRFSPPENNESGAPGAAPDASPGLRLSGGETLPVKLGRRLPATNGEILYALEFAPLPAGVESVTLELPRLAGMVPGAGPENWQIPLRFRPGDPAQIALPVVEVEPTPVLPTATSAPETPILAKTQAEVLPTPDARGFRLALEKTVELPDGYLLMGSLVWADASIQQYAVSLGEPVVLDTAGKEIPSEYASPETFPQVGERRLYWARKVLTREFLSPLRLEFYLQVQETVDATFTFDPGASPREGQVWNLNQPIQAGQHALTVTSARYTQPGEGLTGIEFTFAAAPGVTGAMVYEQSRPPAGGGGGGGIPRDNLPFTSSMIFEGDLPGGPMTVVVHSLDVLVSGEWIVTWTP